MAAARYHPIAAKYQPASSTKHLSAPATKLEGASIPKGHEGAPDARVHFAAFPEPNGIRFGQNRIPFGSAECLTLSVLCIQTMLSALELVRYLY